MRRPIVALLLAVLLSGCAAGVDYRALGARMGGGDCDAATGYLEGRKAKYGRNGRLLYLLDMAQVNMLCGRYEDSNRYFQEADRLAEELWTKSVSREAAAFLTSDFAVPYDGEDFERAFINLFSAINYSLMGRFDEALVEVRRLDSRLTRYNDKYVKKNVYKEDAFGRYLSGIIYEAEGSPDDAFIDYYKAYGAYRDYYEDYGTPVPSTLAEDLLRVARATDRTEEVREEFGLEGESEPGYRESRGMGRIVLIHLNGQSPVKREESLILFTMGGPVKMAFPSYEVHRPLCRQSTLRITSPSQSRTLATELVEDINAIAVKNLQDRKGRVVAKTLARAVAKQAAIHGAANQMESESAREAAKLVLNIVNLVVERADTRSWRTLPGEIYMTRMFVPEGRYDLGVQLCWKNRPLGPVNVKAGETKFVLIDTVY